MSLFDQINAIKDLRPKGRIGFSIPVSKVWRWFKNKKNKTEN
jgi:hypothetical protein